MEMEQSSTAQRNTVAEFEALLRRVDIQLVHLPFSELHNTGWPKCRMDSKIGSLNGEILAILVEIWMVRRLKKSNSTSLAPLLQLKAE